MSVLSTEDSIFGSAKETLESLFALEDFVCYSFSDCVNTLGASTFGSQNIADKCLRFRIQRSVVFYRLLGNTFVWLTWYVNPVNHWWDVSDQNSLWISDTLPKKLSWNLRKKKGPKEESKKKTTKHLNIYKPTNFGKFNSRFFLVGRGRTPKLRRRPWKVIPLRALRGLGPSLRALGPSPPSSHLALIIQLRHGTWSR